MARLLPLPIALAALLLPGEALAFRCGSRLVHEGDTRAELLARCGRPTDVSTRTVQRPAVVWRHGRPLHVGPGPVEKVVETWTYNLGPDRLMRAVTLEDGVVTRIDTLDRGYR